MGRDTLIGPNLVDVDLALLKDTRLSEKVRMQFRAEVFNIANHPNFGLPNGSLFTAERWQVREPQSPCGPDHKYRYAFAPASIWIEVFVLTQ